MGGWGHPFFWSGVELQELTVGLAQRKPSDARKGRRPAPEACRLQWSACLLDKKRDAMRCARGMGTRTRLARSQQKGAWGGQAYSAPRSWSEQGR